MNTLKDIFERGNLLYSERKIYQTYSEEEFTFAQINEKVQLLRNTLYYYGIRKGERIAILAEDTPQWSMAYFAIVTSGCIAVAIPKYRDAEILHRITKATDCKFLLLQSEILSEKTFKDLQEDTPLTIIDIDTYRCILSSDSKNRHIFSSVSSLNSLVMPEVDIFPYDMAAIKVNFDAYSISTTSYTHEQLFNEVEAEIKEYGFTSKDVFMTVLTIKDEYRKYVTAFIPAYLGNLTVFKTRHSGFNQILDILTSIKPSVIITVSKVVEMVYKSRVSQKSREIIDNNKAHFGFFSKFKLRNQATKIRNLLGGNVRVCL
ncbi:MAG: AMP-binding protein [Bacteroidales bacterium]|nr:AMP-binding protein [Bacteroidales bacterium]